MPLCLRLGPDCSVLCQVLEEFYETLSTVSVSALTGEGMDELFEAAERCRAEYNADFKPDLDRRRKVCSAFQHSCCS